MWRTTTPITVCDIFVIAGVAITPLMPKKDDMIKQNKILSIVTLSKLNQLTDTKNRTNC